ncbi:hypothetical protein [Methanosarcina sp.]|jgi:hypothetical protein|nr:hypothetical protein [Methanosarcina sp.]HOW13314.1 hypothetical protein [Methanosarcina sp.]
MKLRIKKYKNKVETELLLKKEIWIYPNISGYTPILRAGQENPEIT